MDAADTAESIREAAEEEAKKAEDEQFRRWAAVAIGVLAMLLAITSLGGDNTGKEIVNNNILATDTWAFYQAKTIRQTDYQLAADELEAQLTTQPTLSANERAEMQERLDRYKATIARLESDPASNEGRRELTETARSYEAQREHAQKQDPNFDYSETLFQIAIVLGSVSIVALARPLLWLALALGGVATLLMLNGFFLFFQLPID